VISVIFVVNPTRAIPLATLRLRLLHGREAIAAMP
jgi:hypothetical protein